MEPTPTTKTIETRCFTTWLSDDGIVRTRVRPGSIVKLADAEENSAAVRAFAKDNQPALLVDIRKIEILDRKAREHFSGRSRKLVVSRIALLVKSPISTFIGNLYMTISPPNAPTRLFTDEAAALAWCRK